MNLASQTTRPPIAVVGVSALFPGSADSTGFWNDLLAGTDRMTPVPSTHWLVDDYFDPDPSAPDKTYGRRGGFLGTIDLDPMAFGVPPNVVPSTDTSQLLALIVAQQVLDDAVRNQFSELDRSRVSVILGVTSGQELLGAMASRLNRPLWLQGMRRAGVPEDVAAAACDQIANLHPAWTESTFPGLLGNVVAGRIANRLDLGGTNCVTDAACASSFSAISMGVNELYLGDSDLVISGGVDTMNDILMYMCFSKTPALSRTEDVRPFSDRADGTMLGEGIGMVALKRLEDAERDGNNIYCVINGVGASSDGRAKSVYAPVAAGQARALESAYAKSGYGPDTVELVEAHGTGTVAGDAAEFAGLETVFNGSGREDRQWCALGSVKSQIGHTKAAAGAAGLIKVIMALHHKVLPPTAKVERPNQDLDLASSPFHLNTRARPWVRGSDHPRRGSVSSFGFGGSNFHVALSEYAGPGAQASRLRASDVELVVLTGERAEDVVAQAQSHAQAADASGYLVWLAQTTQRAYRADAPARLAVVASDESDLQAKLTHAIARLVSSPDVAFTTPAGIFYGTAEHSGDVAFVFPGQGSQYVFMGAHLAMQYGQAMAAWDVAADVCRGSRSVHDVVFPITTFAEDESAINDALLTSTEWAQPAIAATSISMLRVLRSIGVEPKHTAGHSFGEITALHAANVLSESDAFRVARRRGELMAEAARTPGSMTAVTAAVDAVRALAEESGADVVVANHNSPNQVVLSGPTSAIEQVEETFGAHGVAFKRLPVATAFHSAVVSGASDAFGEFLATVTFDAPTVVVHANETAEPYPIDDVEAVRSQLGRQLTRPVRFVELIESMYARGARTFVEVGPSSVLTGLIGSILDGRDHRAIPLDSKHKDGLAAFFGGIGQLAAAGVPMDLGALWAEYGEARDPHQRDEPKLSVPISGANYRKPYPPQDLSELVGPNPPSTEEVPTAPAELPPAAPSPEEVVQEVRPPAPSAAGLVAYQAVQQETAEAHAVYLNSIAQAHTAFLQTAQQSLSALGGHAGLAQPPADSEAVTPGSIITPPVVAPPVMVPTPATPTAPEAVEPEPPPFVPDRPEPAIPVPPPAATPAEVAETSISVDGLTTELLSVVADKTGYPVEMLAMEMELESDLGVDSIKRVEIMSAMQAKLPGPVVDTSVVAGLVTLGQIVDYLAEHVGGLAAPPEPLVTAEPAPASPLLTAPAGNGSSPSLARLVLDAVESPSAAVSTVVPHDGKVAVTDEGGGIGAALVGVLAEHGVDAELVTSVPANGYARVVFLGGLRDVGSIDEAVAINSEAFRVARAVGPSVRAFVTVTDLGGAFGCDGVDPTRAWTSGTTGLARTVAIEWPATQVKAIDVERASRPPVDVARSIGEELLRGGPELEVGLRADGTRLTLKSIPVAVEGGTMPLGPDDVIVASGGGRGVTAAAMIELARATKARFVLLGRSPLEAEPELCATAEDDAALKRVLLDDATAHGRPLSPADLGRTARRILANREIRRTIASIEEAGGEARYLAVDVTDASAVSDALDRTREELGPITGVVHGAGVLADRRIVDKTDDQFDAVFRTKVEGLRALLSATVHDPLKLLFLFSSVAARTGNEGQADYAMANEVLNKVAVAERGRRGAGCVVKSCGWGPWAGGMVDAALAARFEAMGVALIPLDVGARMLVEEVASPQTNQVEVVLGSATLAAPSPAAAH